MRKLFAALIALVLPLCAPVHAGLPINSRLAMNASNFVNITWVAKPGSVYVLYTTTNLSQAWQPVTGQPATFTTTNNMLAVNLPISTVVRFFQVVRLDTQGPQIYQTSPPNNGIGVSQQAILQAWLREETGVDTNSIVFTIGKNPPVTLKDPRLAWGTNGVLTYTPGTNEVLGVLGQTVTASLSVADTLGNATTNFTWDFQLALPTILSTNIVFLGSGTNPPADLFLLFTNGNIFTYAYTGKSSGLSDGMQLINSDPVVGYTITVVSFTEQPTNNTVTVVTRPTLLAELLQEGSLVSGDFTELVSGSIKPLFTLFGLQLNYSYPLNKVLYDDGNMQISTTPGSAMNLDAELKVAADFSGFTLTSFRATLEGTASYQLDFQALAQAADSHAAIVKLVQPVSRTFYGKILGVPVWMTVVFEVDAGFDASLEAQGEITSGINTSGQLLIGQAWDQNTGWTPISQNPEGSFSFQQPAWQIQGSAGLTVYLQPRLTLLVNNAAGVTANLKPYADLQYSFQLNPEECDLSLYAGLDSDIALDLTVWDINWGQLPSATFHLIPQTLLWHTNCADMAPKIISEPLGQSVQAGEPVVFEVEATGAEPMTYQWLRGGLPLTDDGGITGSASATLSVDNVQPSDAGDYSVQVKNIFGSTNSAAAALTVASWTGTWIGTYEYEHETDLYDDQYNPCTNGVDCLFVGGGSITIQLTISGGNASGSMNIDGLTRLDCDCDYLELGIASGDLTGTVFNSTLNVLFNGSGYADGSFSQPFPISFVGTLNTSGNTITGVLSRQGSPTFSGTMTLNHQQGGTAGVFHELRTLQGSSRLQHPSPLIIHGKGGL
jgi:Immunoglobulin I-set domain